jgi:dTMP kinase
MTSNGQEASAPRGKAAFITLEGGEGGGKSTQSKALAGRLRAAGIDVITTREPGGSPAAEAIREALLAGTFKALGTKTEALLFAAARIDHLDTTIKPALEAGTWVICDRFHDSTRAYQGALGALDPAFLDVLERVTLAGTKPDLTFILDLPAKTGLLRAAQRRNPGTAPDRFESESLDFHQKLRKAFKEIAAKEPARCVVVDAAQAAEEVENAIWDTVAGRFGVGRT